MEAAVGPFFIPNSVAPPEKKASEETFQEEKAKLDISHGTRKKASSRNQVENISNKQAPSQAHSPSLSHGDPSDENTVHKLPLIVVSCHVFVDMTGAPPAMLTDLWIRSQTSLGVRLFTMTCLALHP